jgi:VWFA-related protein
MNMRDLIRLAVAAVLGIVLSAGTVVAQQPPTTPAPTGDDSGPVQQNDGIVLKKKQPKDDAPPPPPAPAEEKIKNPKGLDLPVIRVNVPVVTVDVSVLLDKNRQFVPGLKAGNFRVTEDGVPQPVSDLRTMKAPITAVMLLEFASNNWYFIQDMQNTAAAFFRSLKEDDYIAVITYDLRTRILTDFTKDKMMTLQALQTLTIPGFSDTNLFDALYETLDRVSRIEGRKYIVLVGSGRDTFSKINLDTILKKIKATSNVTIFAIGTGQLVRTMAEPGMGGIQRLDYLQADNQMKTFASMTGGLSFFPQFQGALPDIFASINDSIRNQYVLSYKPSNPNQDGSYRKIKVTLVDNEGQPLKMVDEKGKQLKYSIIARDGYTARREVE